MFAILTVFTLLVGVLPMSAQAVVIDGPPPTIIDVCSNIELSQLETPEGMTNNDGICTLIEAPIVDICANLEGDQTVVPEGRVLEGDNQCVLRGDEIEEPAICADDEAVNFEQEGKCRYEEIDDTSTPPRIINTCLVPSTLGDESEFVMGDSGEKTVAEILALHGYGAIDTDADQINYQVWNLANDTAVSVTFTMRVLGKRAGNTQIVGYYKAGDDLTFTAALTQSLDTDGEESVSVTIPAEYANSFGFALQSADKTWFSEKSLNSDEADHVAVYNRSANTYLLAFEDFNNLGDGDYNDIVIEIDEVTCNRTPQVINSCLIPSTLKDKGEFIIESDSGEKTVAEMLADHGYASVDIAADQRNYQVWNLADADADSVTFTMRVLGKRAGNTQIVGYYKAGDDLTFTPVLTQSLDTNGESSVSVTIPAEYANSFGFALQSADKTWFSEKALNDDEKDHVAVYNPSANTYLLAFEDFNNLGDSDYNDIVIEIAGVTCNRDGGDGDNEDKDTYEIFGFVWHDEDEDDNRDEEPVLEGWTVRAVNVENNEAIYFDVTDENGRYSFFVPAGTWEISELTEDGWVLLSLADGDGTYTVTVPEVEEFTLLDWLVPTAHAAVLGSYGPYNFGNDFVGQNRGGGNGGSGTRTKRAPRGEVLGSSTSTPAGLVLGEATSTIPVGAPNTGAGGMSPLSISLPVLNAYLPTRLKITK